MKTYLDSSCLVSAYSPDAHSVAASSELALARGTTVLSSLTEAEFVNALELRVFRKELPRDEVNEARAAFDEDVRRGVLTVFDLEPAVFARARKLILEFNASLGCRTADILHVAAALEIGADRLLTFDQRQKELAKRVKLATN